MMCLQSFNDELELEFSYANATRNNNRRLIELITQTIPKWVGLALSSDFTHHINFGNLSAELMDIDRKRYPWPTVKVIS
jgi:hypothetical protein